VLSLHEKASPVCVYKRATQDFFIINTIKQTIMKKNIFKTLAVTVLSAVSLTAYADDQKAYADYDVTTDANKTKYGDDLTALQVTFNGKPWYIIEDNSIAVDAGTVTLLAAEKLGTSEFHNSSNKYSTSTIRTKLDNMTASGGSFAEVASAINTVKVKGSDSDDEVDAKLYLLNTTEANNVPVNVRMFNNDWWLCSQGLVVDCVASVSGGSGNVDDDGYDVYFPLVIRPALQLDLSKVSFDTETNTFSVAPTTSVATPTLSPADAAKSNIWYDLNGRHYQGKPTMQGVYINNHQKYVVK
jgi:hypothetical protein